MISKRLYTIPLIVVIGLCLLISVPASAETEPNDSLLAPEVVGEGTFTGTVSKNGTEYTDKDYYKISVPSKKDIDVTVTKTDTGYGSISVYSYDENRNLMGLFSGIWIIISTGGSTETDSWYNSEGSSTDIYLEVEGDGDYRISIKFTDETSSTRGACLIVFIVLIVIIVVGLGLTIFLIIFFKKREKKKKASQPGVQVTSNILRSEVVDVRPPMQPVNVPPQQPQYQPQTPPPQQPQYPPQQQMVQQQPQAPPAVPPVQQQMVQPIAQQQPATPPPQQPAIQPRQAAAPPPQGVPPQYPPQQPLQ